MHLKLSATQVEVSVNAHTKYLVLVMRHEESGEVRPHKPVLNAPVGDAEAKTRSDGRLAGQVTGSFIDNDSPVARTCVASKNTSHSSLRYLSLPDTFS